MKLEMLLGSGNPRIIFVSCRWCVNLGILRIWVCGIRIRDFRVIDGVWRPAQNIGSSHSSSTPILRKSFGLRILRERSGGGCLKFEWVVAMEKGGDGGGCSGGGEEEDEHFFN